MKLTLESTECIVNINGAQCRIWRGYSESGIPCTAWVALIAVRNKDDLSEFDAELVTRPQPHPHESEVWPLRMVL